MVILSYFSRIFAPAFSLSYIFFLSNAKLFLKLQLLVVMLHPSSPEHNDKPDAEQWIDNSGKLFQTPDLIFVGLLPDFILVKFLECLFLFLFIDIDKLSPPKIQFFVLVDYITYNIVKGTPDPSVSCFHQSDCNFRLNRSYHKLIETQL